MGELEIEGPTAREVVFVRARDDLRLGSIFFYGRITDVSEADATVNFTSTSLGRYDPDHDYSTNRSLAFGEALGAQYVTHSLFEGRLLQRKGRPLATPAPLMHANVPILPEAPPDVLARIAAEDEVVAGLRSAVRRSFRHVRAGSDAEGRAVAEGLAQELDEAARRLEERMRVDRRWKVGAPVLLGAGAVAIGAVAGGPLGAAGAALSALGGLTPAVADRAAYRRDPGFALVLARRAVAR